MTTCRRWTTTTCAAASRPCTRPGTRRPRSSPATRCRATPSSVLAEEDTHADPAVRLELVRCLSQAAGARGMCGGQMIDMLAERAAAAGRERGRPAADAEDRQADRIRRRGGCGARQGAGRRSGTRCWPMAATSAPPSRSPTTCWTPTATPRRPASATGKDAAAGKATLVTLLGARAAPGCRPNAWSAQAKDHLDGFGESGRPLARCSPISRSSGGADMSHHPPSTPLLDRVASRPTCATSRPTSSSSWPTSCAPRRSTRSPSTGGHLGAALGVVELTVAIHAVFETPRDRLIWDVGHQAYPHKILTGRRDRIRTLRQGGGLSGFTRRAESEYDPFGAAHSSHLDLRRPRHGRGARPEGRHATTSSP